jgi:hypothetical protein
MKISLLTFLGFYLIGPLGTGGYDDVTIEVIKREVRAGSIFDYLRGRIEFFDDSLLDNDDRAELLAEWRGMLDVDQARKFNVDKNGLALLVAYLLEGIQRRAREAKV